MNYIRRDHSLSDDKSYAGLADGVMTVCQKLAGLPDFGKRDRPDIFLLRTVLSSHSDDRQLGPRGSECVAWDPGGRCPRLSWTSSSDVGKVVGRDRLAYSSFLTQECFGRMFIALWGSRFIGHRRWAIGSAPVANEWRLHAFYS
jgi:hypothetical protein